MNDMLETKCEISDCEDSWDNNSSIHFDYESTSSENDEFGNEELAKSYFDPTKITTSLPLLPFNNQVGGHASFFRFSKRALCKPVCAREQEFYEYIDAKHHELLPFTCQYMGVLNVTYRSNNDCPVPEVVFEKNKHLLRDWRACTFDNHNGRRHSSTTLNEHSCRTRARKFQEQVLKEVFSPQALKERLVLAEDWRKRNRLSSVSSTGSFKELKSTSKPPLVKKDDCSHSYSDELTESKHWGDSIIVQGAGSVPIMRSLSFSSTPTTQDDEEIDLLEDDGDDESSVLTDSIDHLTIEPRRPSTTGTTSKKAMHPLDDDQIFTMDDFDVDKNDLDYKYKRKKSANMPVLQVDSTYLHNKQKFDSPVTDTANDKTPWSLQIYNRDLQKMRNNTRKQSLDDNQQKYILIEDLTDGVKYPCVLDLKMGTRQYGVYATREKMKSQTKKCENSTSKILGVRVCGMQVYNTDLNDFNFQDKYFGRTLTPLTFCDTLETYLDNGQGCQYHHIPVIIRKLRRLARIIKSMNDYRLYSSSLLLIYDGDPDSLRKIDVRIIDFANCVTSEDVRFRYKEFTYPPRHKGPDNGYLLGLKSLVMCFEWIYKKHCLQDMDQDLSMGDDVFSDIYDATNNETLSSILQ